MILCLLGCAKNAPNSIQLDLPSYYRNPDYDPLDYGAKDCVTNSNGNVWCKVSKEDIQRFIKNQAICEDIRRNMIILWDHARDK